MYNAQKIQELLESPILHSLPLSGTSFVNAYKLKTARGNYFLKCSEQKTPFFLKEASGLREMAKSKAIDVAKVVGVSQDFLLLDFVESHAPRKDFFAHFSISLANMHRTSQDHCGFFEDNFLGATPQPNHNPQNLPWSRFFWEKRLLYQCQLGVKNALIPKGLEKEILQLKDTVVDLLTTDAPPSLLHGDLWSGNYLVNSRGKACLIDPACYYGHREAELAMCRLFGGFPPEFYHGYNEEYPLEKGVEKRLPLYQLYHVLNHLNLFGGHYLESVQRIVEGLIR